MGQQHQPAHTARLINMQRRQTGQPHMLSVRRGFIVLLLICNTSLNHLSVSRWLSGQKGKCTCYLIALIVLYFKCIYVKRERSAGVKGKATG